MTKLALVRLIAVGTFLASFPGSGSASDFGRAQPPFPDGLAATQAPEGPGASWRENFDAYTTGSELIGQGGWEGWGGDGTVGALTSSAHALSSANSVDIVGDTDLVHQYSIAAGKWVYSAWQYLPTGFSGKSYFILVNAYPTVGNQSWSVQLCFDSVGGVVRDDAAGDCAGPTTQPLVLDQWVEIRVLIDLAADTATVFYNNQALYSGTWSSHVLGGGALSLRAVDLFANTATSAFYDNLSLVSELFLDGFESEDTTAWDEVP